MYTIHEIADIAGISVRTLHYYDQIGLLVPPQKTEAGYRLYCEADVVTLHQIMLLKELGFSLKRIGNLGAKNALSDKNVLIAQRNVLEKKNDRLKEIISMIDEMIDGECDIMNKKDMFKAFDMSEIENAQNEYADEVRKKYPKQLVDESYAKTSKYNKQDWQQIMQTQNDIFVQFAEHLNNGDCADKEDVQKLVGVFQQHICKNFYTCDSGCLLGLGDLYVTDERFTAYYEKIKPGLAQYIRQAIQSYCE